MRSALATLVILLILAAAPACTARLPVPPTAAASDSLIRPGEEHFAHLWQPTFGGGMSEDR